LPREWLRSFGCVGSRLMKFARRFGKDQDEAERSLV